MTPIPSDSNLSSRRIDRFSSLPNELLDKIFEHLYDQPPPPLPLSKRLRPWFEKHFFRKLSFSSFDSLAQFADILFKSPRIAQYVLVFKLEEEEESDEDDEDSSEEDSEEEDEFEGRSQKRHKKVHELHSLLPALLPLFTQLVKLDVPYCPPIVPPIENRLSTPAFLPRLRYLATSFHHDDDEEVEFEKLAQFASLPALKRLKIYEWDEVDFQNCHRSESTLLPTVTTLEIRGFAAFKASIQALTDLCPSLLHLELRSSESYGSPYVDCIPYLPNTLLSLSIFLADHDNDYELNSNLAHLHQLRYLHLGSTSSSEDIFETLRGLKSLVHLRLGKGDYSLDRLAILIPRLPRLEMLTLDIDAGVRGERILGPSSVGFDVDSESARCSIRNMEEDWKLPGDEGEDDHIDVDGLRRVLGEAQSIGIIVNEAPYLALQLVADFHVKANNRAVVAAAYGHELWYLEQSWEQAAIDGVDLPDYDLEPLKDLESEQLEILEEELPDREWYMLSIAKKENYSEEEEEEE